MVGIFAHTNGRDQTGVEIDKIIEEIKNLCMILSDQCFGYKFGGDEFAMLIHDDKNNESTTLTSKEIISSLIDNVRSNCELTISVGFTRYFANNGETFKEWKKRANNYLDEAKKKWKKSFMLGSKY